MASRGDSTEESSPREDNTRGKSYSVPKQQGLETDVSSDGPPTQQGAANHPNRAWRVCQSDSSYRGNGPLISPEEAARKIRTQGFPPRESGISPDGFPSRSMEAGGVSGLFGQRESIQVSKDSTSSENPCPSPSSPCSPNSASAASFTIGEYDASVHTARAIPLRRVRPGRRGEERPGENREPSPAALDRIDDRIEDCERVWADDSRGAAGHTRESRQQEDRMLTGGREIRIDPFSQGSDPRAVSQHVAPTSSRPRHRPGDAVHPTGRAGELPPAPGGHHAHPQRVSSTPSESSIAETIFNVRQPTPPPHQPTLGQLGHQSNTASLPRSRRHAATAVGPSGNLRQGPSHPATNAVREEPVPAVLVPGGRLGFLGGSHPRQPP
ncbi:hypothetical protein KVR01_005576 [Diaporthe batatas]|uniref:uncharacterized protein n=1 Tax=Diaporthe batatas TaxID=748121 RepID=UPI001D04DAB1|nr:uncharacterized protein KVR01_005576 [Diaporthe batatas]KAG8165301.1 hypothetical protein KVR01_005576 [Diaporthe batatas]